LDGWIGGSSTLGSELKNQRVGSISMMALGSSSFGSQANFVVGQNLSKMDRDRFWWSN